MPAAAPSAASRRVTSPLPRTTTSGTSSGRPTSASAPAWPGVGTSCTASAGTPLAASAGAITCSTRACALPSAAAPVRRTAALRALSTCDATSTVTLGRASNTAPITPTGTRRSYTRSPVGSVADEHLQRRLGGGGEDVELGGHVGEALGGEAEAVEQALGHAARLGGLDVGAVGGEQRPRPARAGARRRRAARRRSPGRPRPGRPARPRRRARRPRGRRPARGCACRRRRCSRAQPATAVGPAPPRPNPTSQRRSLPHRGRGAGAEHLRPTCPPTPPRRGHGRHAEAAAPVRSTRNLRGAPPGCGDG